jgi:hypothetical protein
MNRECVSEMSSAPASYPSSSTTAAAYNFIKQCRRRAGRKDAAAGMEGEGASADEHVAFESAAPEPARDGAGGELYIFVMNNNELTWLKYWSVWV